MIYKIFSNFKQKTMSTGTKTNLIGYFSLVIVLGALAAIFLDKITGTEFVSILGGVGAFAGIMVAFFTKSHSYEYDKYGTVDPDNPKYPPNKG